MTTSRIIYVQCYTIYLLTDSDAV